ncbi:glycosyltransferase family 4 protein [candidate division KSB1 bacterium]|nr:glycosyltransferase family 4 protein [candidate division KSB1 bacterium]
MKLIFYCSKFPPLAGGAGTNAHYMAKYLSNKGHQVHVVCEHIPGLKKEEQINQNYFVHRVSVPVIKNRGSGVYFLLLCLAVAFKGIRLIKREKPDILHLFDAATGIAGLFTKFMIPNIPSIYLFGGSITYEYMCNAYTNSTWDPAKGENYVWRNARGVLKLLLFVEKQFFLRNDRVYTNAQYLSDMLAEHLNLGYPKVRLIYNGIDTGYLNRAHIEDIKEKYGFDRLIYVGVRFVKYKALHVLIEACKPLLEELHLHLVIAGDGPEEQHLKRMANGHPKILFLGNISWEENIKYVRSADVFALPTLVDKTPNCIMEALSLEVPTITTRIPGVEELITDGGGLLIEPNDVEALREAIRWVVEHPVQGREMGAIARQFMQTEFDWKVTCSRIEQIYTELVSEKEGTTS